MLDFEILMHVCTFFNKSYKNNLVCWNTLSFSLCFKRLEAILNKGLIKMERRYFGKRNKHVYFKIQPYTCRTVIMTFSDERSESSSWKPFLLK